MDECNLQDDAILPEGIYPDELDMIYRVLTETCAADLDGIGKVKIATCCYFWRLECLLVMLLIFVVVLGK